MAEPASPKPDRLRSLSRRLVRRLRGSSRRAYERLFSPRGEYHKRWSMTLRQWFIYHQREIGFTRCTWMGVRALKNPLDAWIYQEILYEVRPEVVIEIGSAHGGTTLYFAHLLDLLGGGTVISVDIDRSRFRASHPRIELITGDSSAPDTVARVRELVAGRSALVVQDGDHRKRSVLADLEAYAPLVSRGSYLIVEDSITDLFQPGDSIGTAEEGPLAALEEFVGRHPEFAVDSERERYLLTYNPRGFLRRVR